MTDSTDHANATKSRPPRNPPRPRRVRKILMSLVLVLVGGIVAAGFIPATRWAEGTGYVMTDDEAEIRPSVQGAIAAWLVNSGDLVASDQPVIQLNDKVQRAALEGAEKQQMEAEARLDHRKKRITLADKKRQEQVSRAEKKLKLAREQLKKMEAAQSLAISERELEEARLNVQVASSELKELKLPSSEVEAQELEMLTEQLAAARKKVELCQAELDLRKIRSPLAGTIYFNSFEPGEVVKPEHVLGQVFDRSRWIVKLKVGEKDLPHVKVGQAVEVELSAYSAWSDKPLSARVSRILPVVTPQATGDGIFYIEAELEIPEGLAIEPGMKVSRARIDTGRTTWLARLLES
jgi:multidrug resistance efflux pump